LKLLLGKVVHR